MTVLGTVYLSGCNYQIGYDLVSQSTANNTSTVKFYGVLNVTNNYVSWSSGSASVRGISTGIGTYYSKGSHTLIQTQVTITHNADGTYSATVSGSLSTTFVSGTASGKITLPTIPRASQPSINTWPNNSPNFNIGDTITIHMNRKSTSFTHKVVFKLNNYSYTIANSGVTNNVTFDTSTIANNIYAQIPNSTVANGTIEVTTYNGSTTIGTKSCNFSAKAVGVNPTFNVAYLDTNNTTTTITGNNQKIIQAKSTLQINATSLSAKKSATLSSIKAVINGTTYNATISGTSATFNIGTLNLSSNITATLTLTDSRGLTATKSLTIQMLAWALPTAIITTERENNFYNPTTINVDASYSSLDSHNTITIQMRYKKTTDSSYSSYQTLQDNTPVTLQLDNEYQWNVQVVLTDRLGSKTYNVIVERGIPIVFFDKNKRSVGINKFPANNTSLEVDGKLYVSSFTRNTSDTWIPVVGSGGVLDYTLRKIVSSKTHSDYNNSQDSLATLSMLSYWNGAYNNSHSSNLTYAHQGEIQCKPTQLYNNASGTNGTVTLSSNYTNFTYLEVFYGNVNSSKDLMSSCRVQTDKSGFETITYRKSGNNLYINTATWKLGNSNKLTPADQAQTQITTSGATFSTASNVYIYRVLGWK